MNFYRNITIFGLLIASFIILDMSGCTRAKAEEYDLKAIEEAFSDSELDAETAQLKEEFEIGEEVFSPDNRIPAHHVPTPKPFEDSDIERKLKDGTVQKFDGDEYMIVKRTHSHAKKKQALPVVQYVDREVKTSRKRRISVFVGHGPTDNLEVIRNNNGSASVQNDTGMVGTAQYQQVFNEKGWNWGVQLQTNETVSIGIGKDF